MRELFVFSVLILVASVLSAITATSPLDVPVRLRSSDPLEIWRSTATSAAKSVSEHIKSKFSSEVLVKNVNLNASSVSSLSLDFSFKC